MTIDNFFEMFDGILNPKQLEGLRLLLTPFPQQQFNQTEDRRTVRPAVGWPASTATPTGTPTRPPISSATSARRSSAAASTPPACAA